MTTTTKGDTMGFYLMKGFNLIAYVPSDARDDIIGICNRLRNRDITTAILGDIVADRALGIIEGGKDGR